MLYVMEGSQIMVQAIREELDEALLQDYSSPQDLLGEDGAVEIAIARDRNGTVEPQIVVTGQTRSTASTIGSSVSTGAGSRSGTSRGIVGALRCRDFSGSDQPGHRRGAGGDPGLAEPAARSSLPGRLLRQLGVKIGDLKEVKGITELVRNKAV
jgi:hypothetical protein